MPQKIYLSPPHMGGLEQQYVAESFATNWIAPAGPQIEAFETEFANYVGADYALAVSSGSAALHLALIELGITAGDEVLISSLTFAASAFPVLYLGATPTFIDCEETSWNMDPALLAEALSDRAAKNKLPKAVVLVHLYGQCADIEPIAKLCKDYGVALIEDAAEALGATYKGRAPGCFGEVGFYSFNGNKIITTSGGGMLVSNNEALIRHARKLSTQARDPFPYYEHTEVGYNYRMSSICAAIGRGQLAVIEDRVQARRSNFEYYQQSLAPLPGISFMPEATWGRSNRWLTCILIDADLFGASNEDVRLLLEAADIESRPIWKPMHLQPVFKTCTVVGGAISEKIFMDGLCLPSGSSLSLADLERITDVIRGATASC